MCLGKGDTEELEREGEEIVKVGHGEPGMVGGRERGEEELVVQGRESIAGSGVTQGTIMGGTEETQGDAQNGREYTGGKAEGTTDEVTMEAGDGGKEEATAEPWDGTEGTEGEGEGRMVEVPAEGREEDSVEVEEGTLERAREGGLWEVTVETREDGREEDTCTVEAWEDCMVGGEVASFSWASTCRILPAVFLHTHFRL